MGELKELLKTVVPVKKVETTNVVPLREYPLLASLDEMLDEFYKGEFNFFNPEVYQHLKDSGYKPNDAMIAYRYYAGILLDLIESKEGYEHLKRKKRSNYIKFLEAILDDLKLFATNERTIRKTRKPRTRKVKSASQLAANVKFKDEDRALKLGSMHPEKIIESGSVWLYNTKYKKLTYIVAENGKKLSIKGQTIINMDSGKSVFKRLRKPQELNEMIKGTPAKVLREFKKLRTKAAPATGRLNAETMILKVSK